MKRDITKIFIDEKHSKPPKKNYPMKKITNNRIDEIWSFDSLGISGYKVSNINGLRNILVIIDIFSKYI